MNQEKKYLSSATIVIEPEENKIVNIEEVYSIEAQSNRINNQMAILKSDEVQEYIVKDKKMQCNSKTCTRIQTKTFSKEYITKRKIIDDNFFKKYIN